MFTNPNLASNLELSFHSCVCIRESMFRPRVTSITPSMSSALFASHHNDLYRSDGNTRCADLTAAEMLGLYGSLRTCRSLQLLRRLHDLRTQLSVSRPSIACVASIVTSSSGNWPSNVICCMSSCFLQERSSMVHTASSRLDQDIERSMRNSVRICGIVEPLDKLWRSSCQSG